MSELSDALYDWMRAIGKLREAIDKCDYDADYLTYYEREECARAEEVYVAELRKALALTGETK